ncbi:MAG: SusD/RagB family nutrient-binding outer membrane lipoprotein [bacterium]
MTTMTKRALVGAGIALLVGANGCKDFLTDPDAVRDPNRPSVATRNQLLAGIEAQLLDEQEGGVAMIVCQWMQQCAGIGGRFVEVQGHYAISGSNFDLNFSGIYTGGGLVALRAAQVIADADQDAVYKGVLEVIEAMQIGWATDIWGDIPYSDAAGANPTPRFDGQMAIYDALQTLLDKAIADLAGAGAGPGVADILYGGDKTKWTQLANTLKARFYLHTVEKLGVAQYPKVLAAATKGISSSGNSLLAVHSSATSERNLWAQFQLTSFGNDLVAGKVLADLMNADADPRRPEYFGRNPLGGFGGHDAVTNNTPATQISPILGSGRTDNPVFGQPLVTWEENQLILAEANFVTNGAAGAQPFLDAVRAKAAKQPRPATLQSIMEEKYIILFQNVEFWNDYKRNCHPRLKPASASFTTVPGRLLYGTTEKQTNPDDPSVKAEGPLQSYRNANDPAACPPS